MREKFRNSTLRCALIFPLGVSPGVFGSACQPDRGNPERRRRCVRGGSICRTGTDPDLHQTVPLPGSAGLLTRFFCVFSAHVYVFMVVFLRCGSLFKGTFFDIALCLSAGIFVCSMWTTWLFYNVKDNESSKQCFTFPGVRKWALLEAVIGVKCPLASAGGRLGIQPVWREHHQDKVGVQMLLSFCRTAQIIIFAIHTCRTKSNL